MKDIAIITLFLATIVTALVGASYYLAYKIKPSQSILALALYFWAGTILFFVTTLSSFGYYNHYFRRDFVFAILGGLKLFSALFVLITTWKENKKIE